LDKFSQSVTLSQSFFWKKCDTLGLRTVIGHVFHVGTYFLESIKISRNAIGHNRLSTHRETTEPHRVTQMHNMTAVESDFNELKGEASRTGR